MERNPKQSFNNVRQHGILQLISFQCKSNDKLKSFAKDFLKRVGIFKGASGVKEKILEV
jgi:hypothetical protein